MNMIWLSVTLLLSLTSVISGQNIDTRHIRVFPGANQSVAGVFQVSHLDHLNKAEYAYNASEARQLCSALGVIIASKSDVQTALLRGLETCRFGWIDEHLAIVPRSKALPNCGKNQTGLVTWRTPVTHKFDVFCFNETDAAIQLRDTTTVWSSRYTQSTSTQTTSTFSTSPPSSPLTSETFESEAKPAQYVSRAQGTSEGKAILIITTCALLLIAIIISAYLTLRRRSDMKLQQKEEHVETEEWTCLKVITEAPTASQEDESIEVDENTEADENTS